LYSYDSKPNCPKYSHTFATVVRATGETADLRTWRLEAHSISWMPATLQIRVCRLRPEPGTNLTLKGTLQFAVDNGFQIKQWGPYAIRPRSYWRFLSRVQSLESGSFQYQAVDPLQRDVNVTDCIHAISDLDPIHERTSYLWIRFGDNATHHLVKMMHRNQGIIDPGMDLAWMSARMGLDCFPIEQQHFVHRKPPSNSPRVRQAMESAPLILEKVPDPDFVVPALQPDGKPPALADGPPAIPLQHSAATPPSPREMAAKGDGSGPEGPQK
jgi:hypothetical protein